MTIEIKKQIAAALEAFVTTKGSASKAATELAISDAYLSHIRAGKWDAIADKKWRELAKKLSVKSAGWNIARTATNIIILQLLNDAQQRGMVYAIVNPAGSGKSATATQYTGETKECYLLKCEEHWNAKTLLSELALKMGFEPSGYTKGELLNELVTRLKQCESPLMIWDEVNRLNDKVLYFFITLYNRLEGDCGIVMLATDQFEKRMKRGLALNKPGYQEIHSRLGRRYIKAENIKPVDIAAVCQANGITNQTEIQEIVEDSEFDLRRVRRNIEKVLKRNSK